MLEKNTDRKKYVVTIDGPAGAGKTTIARKLAYALNYTYLDTGAMYRAITWKGLEQNVDMNDEQALVALAANAKIELFPRENYTQVILDGKDISNEIRTPRVSKGTSNVADAEGVRKILVREQQRLARTGGVVLEGRDTGTVVCPQAEKKFYLDASIEERAKRRLADFREKGIVVEYDKLVEDISTRDQRDKSRSVGALRKSEDAMVIDTTSMSIDEVIKAALVYIKQ